MARVAAERPASKPAEPPDRRLRRSRPPLIAQPTAALSARRRVGNLREHIWGTPASLDIVIRKRELAAARPELNARDVAWDYLFQRLRNVTAAEPIGARTILLAHDEGEEVTIRKLARRARRAGTAGSMFGTGMLRVPFTKLIDDPVPKKSAHSFFIQLADLAAYAAFRRLYPPPPRLVPIVDETTWDELGPARRALVTYSRDPVGIVHWPGAAQEEEEPPG